MVSALLIKNGHTAQTHKGVAGLFALHYVKEGIVSKEAGKTYNQILSLRQTGDYDDWNFLEPEDVIRMFEPAETLLQTVEDLINK
ncbi:MAG: HEPN domain-containing protein [Tannerellaceae bacterium]|nr:HEPN domain-containing protein [Tannerellaceae bacterium]